MDLSAGPLGRHDGVVLEMRPACERCAAPLPATRPHAWICAHKCTWCADCAHGPLGAQCPNCRGALRPRPPRSSGGSRGSQWGVDPVLERPRALHADELRTRLPLPANASWPEGVPFAIGLAHGSMSVELYAPVGVDRQTPHDRDELYVIEDGSARLRIEDTTYAVRRGDVAFVRAGERHRFEEFDDGFATWVIFWGPVGGEA